MMKAGSLKKISRWPGNAMRSFLIFQLLTHENKSTEGKWLDWTFRRHRHVDTGYGVLGSLCASRRVADYRPEPASSAGAAKVVLKLLKKLRLKKLLFAVAAVY
jgi:hypothetical protein